MPEKLLQLLPFVAMGSGKPKLNTAKMTEMGITITIILGFLTTQISKIDEKVDRVIVVQTEEKVALKNLTSTVVRIEKEVDKLNQEIFISRHKLGGRGD
ncbi:hypothetical protein MNBD_GAMMA01-1324 [hydrothermal vent metagenome]|uniref:Uncharacterized protein n=1 Tax=hydrothermal vent metagenome TaxID=652676 RepID=A0A3B0W5L8_9ZZZZ